MRAGDILGIVTLFPGVMPVAYDTGVSDDQIAAVSCGPMLGDLVGASTTCPGALTSQRRVNVAATLKRRR